MTSEVAAKLIVSVETVGADSAVRSLKDLAVTGSSAEAATGNLRSSSRDLSEAMSTAARAADSFEAEIGGVRVAADQAAQSARTAALSFTDFYNAAERDFSLQYVQQANRVTAAHVAGAKAARLQSYEMVNLGRQFADVGVSLASGQALWMVAIQQGAQIGEVYGVAATRGVTFGGVLRQLAGAAVPVVAALAPIAAIVGAAAGGFALLNRELQKGMPADLTEGLNLTEEQLKRVEDRTVTMGDTWQATLEVMGKYLTAGPIGDALSWLGKTWTATLDWITKAAFNTTAVVVGAFTGSYKAIVGNWRSFPAILGDVFAMAANLAIEGVERLVNASVAGLNRLFDVLRILPQYSWLPTIPQADLDGFKLQVSGAAEFFGQAFVTSIAQDIEATKAAMRGLYQEIGDGARDLARERILEQAGDAAEESAKKAKKAGEVTVREIKLVNANLADFAVEAVKVNGSLETMYDRLGMTAEQLKEGMVYADDWGANLAAEARKAEEAFYSVANAIDSIFFSLADQNWAGALSGLIKAVGSIKGSIGQIGFMGTAGNVLSVLGQHTGNNALSSIGGGLGIAAMGASAGSALGALGGQMILAGGTGALGGAGLGLASMSSLLGPIGIIAGVAYALSGLFKGKPTNAGAGYDLISGQLSGDKRTPETEKAVMAAADAIRVGQDALTSAGLTLTDSVRGLVIGTRDPSQIYMGSGRTLTAGVGDAAAAAEAALLALLDGATYADEQQRILVESMRAAGKGFDDIAAALETYAGAQGLEKSLSDAILKLTDPDAYALSELEAMQAARRDEVKALYDQLMISEERFEGLNAQLAELEALELADTLERFGAGAASATAALQDAVTAGADRIAEAFAQASGAMTANAQRWLDLADGLSGYRRSLLGGGTSASPLTAYRSTSNVFRQTLAAAKAGDYQAGTQVQGASQAYLDAALAVSPDRVTYQRAFNEVMVGLSEVETAAETNAGAQVEQLRILNANMQAIQAELQDLRATMAEVAKSSDKTARVLTFVSEDGQALKTVAA